VRVRNTYENQLAELCGTMVGVDGRVYPAISKYAALNENARRLADPCGLMGNGAIHEAIAGMELSRLDAKVVAQAAEDVFARIDIEVDRVNVLCAISSTLADYRYRVAGQTNNLNDAIRSSQREISTLNRVIQSAQSVSELM